MKQKWSALKSVAVALAILSAVISPPAQASWLRPTPGDMVKWAGCSATLVTSSEHSPYESFYDPSQHRIYFGTKPEPGMREALAEQILLHETGHCLQWQKGVNPADYDWDHSKLELEADYIGVGLACSVLHRDGAQLNHDLLLDAHQRFDYNGDPNHGTLEQRIRVGYTNPACAKPSNPGA